MSTETTSSLLDEVLGEALEVAAFAEAIPVDEGWDWQRDDVTWARIELRAPLSGVVLIGIGREAAEALASDAWGEDVDDELVLAFAGELVNTVAGQLLARTGTPEVELGLPSTGFGAVGPGEVGTTRTYDVDGAIIAVAIAAGAREAA